MTPSLTPPRSGTEPGRRFGEIMAHLERDSGRSLQLHMAEWAHITARMVPQ